MENNAAETQNVPKKFNRARYLVSQLAGLVFAFLIFLFFMTSLDNIGFTTNISDYQKEIKSLFHTPKVLPAVTPAEPANLVDLVPADLYPSFYLIQTDSQFSDLADLVTNYHIPLHIQNYDCKGGQACYVSIHGVCNYGNPGQVYVQPGLMGGSREFIAGILVHELTHAKNKLTNPGYYCNDNTHLSNEFLAYKSQAIFSHQYERFGFFDYYDLSGTFHDYPLYLNTKGLYPSLIDDMNLAPTGDFFDTNLNSFYTT